MSNPSNNLVIFTVNGPPAGKGRPRVTNRGAFTPKKTRQYEKHVRACAQVEMMRRRGWNPDDWFVMELDIHHAKGRYPDADNVIKSIMDALEGVVWKNDRTVIPAVKHMVLNSSDPHVDVEITRVPVVEQIS